MLNLVNRYKKGVSPVIAVVLLIALTVAAIAVIWAITSGFLGGSTAVIDYTVNSESQNATHATVTVTLSVSQEASIDAAGDVKLVKDTTNYAVAEVTDGFPVEFTANDDKTLTFVFTTGETLSGDYILRITFNIDGNDQNHDIDVSF